MVCLFASDVAATNYENAHFDCSRKHFTKPTGPD